VQFAGTRYELPGCTGLVIRDLPVGIRVKQKFKMGIKKADEFECSLFIHNIEVNAFYCFSSSL
jgi:hypothetical protein